MSFDFESAKDPAEKVVLTFDFSDELESGETITGILLVSITSPQDASASGVLNGAASFNTGVLTLIDGTQVAIGKAVLQPVQAGVSNAGYAIKVKVSTSNANKVLAMTGVLQIAEGA